MSCIDGELLSRWQSALDIAACSPLEFYDLVADELASRDLPGLRFSYCQRKEGGWFSPKRRYLRVRFEKLYFDISASVVGKSLVVSWWLHKDLPGVTDLFAEIPGLGMLINRTVRATTYFHVDLIEHLQTTVHSVVVRVLSELSDPVETTEVDEID